MVVGGISCLRRRYGIEAQRSMPSSELLIRAIAACLIVGSSLLAGYRAHRWIEHRTTLRLPLDIGVRLGLAIGLASAYAAL